MSLDDTLHVAGLVEDSIVDGDGFRFTIFVQGCKRRCPNCQNPETQPLEGGHEETLAELLQKIRQNPLLTGVTFSGGEPFLQCAPLAELAREIHTAGLDIWSYSGYTLEECHAQAGRDCIALRRLNYHFPFSETRRHLGVSNVPRGRLKLHLWIPPDDFTPISSARTLIPLLPVIQSAQYKMPGIEDTSSRYLAFSLSTCFPRKQGKDCP